MPDSARSVVVLPAPLEPISVTSWPSGTSSDDAVQHLHLAVAGDEVLDVEHAGGLRRGDGAAEIGRDHASGRPAPRPARPRRSSGRNRARSRVSQMLMTTSMWCSIRITVMPWSRILRMIVDQLLDVGRGEPGGRLVEQQQLRVERQRAADLEQALLAVGQVARLLVGERARGRRSAGCWRRGSARAALLAARARRCASATSAMPAAVGVVQADHDVLDQRQLAEQLHVLEGARDAGGRRSRAICGRRCWCPRTATSPAVGT